MKPLWYISILVFIFTFLGVVNHNQIPEPNQEIVLQFTHLKVSENETKNTIAIVKEQLQTIGVANIQVEELKTGGLKITYYSKTDATSVKKMLLEERGIVLENTTSNSKEKPTKIPSDKKASSYNLDVFEIHKNDLNTGFGGSCALEIKSDYNRFFIPNLSIPSQVVTINTFDSFVKETYKFRRNSAIAKDNTSYIIPEVRAGPRC